VGYKAAYDGVEDFVLRKTWFQSGILGNFELFFHWEVLYSTIYELVGGRHWYSKWLVLLMNWKRAGYNAKQLSVLQSIYRHFRKAIQDVL
jgi:hypothetical protein